MCPFSAFSPHFFLVCSSDELREASKFVRLLEDGSLFGGTMFLKGPLVSAIRTFFFPAPLLESPEEAFIPPFLSPFQYHPLYMDLESSFTTVVRRFCLQFLFRSSAFFASSLFFSYCRAAQPATLVLRWPRECTKFYFPGGDAHLFFGERNFLVPLPADAPYTETLLEEHSPVRESLLLLRSRAPIYFVALSMVDRDSPPARFP